MKKVFAFIAVSVLFALNANHILAQRPTISTETRQRPASPNVTKAPLPKSTETEVRQKAIIVPPSTTAPKPVIAAADKQPVAQRQLAPNVIRGRIIEAQRFFKTRPKQTALKSPALDVVTIALLDHGTARIHLLTISKETFLTKGAEVEMATSLGTPVTLRVLRANGVNTAITAIDSAGRSLMPLAIEYPIEHNGAFREMAYYTSAHPALLSTELARTGRAYVRSMVDVAAKRLREKGAFISPNIVDVAERLCLVEHVDHDRFRNENRKTLFDEIFSLYALNEMDTYRYSVSVAGAGGMVQMIPWAYNLERQRHPAVGLMPDFVTGMRNHPNALQAMLLYMQDTWDDLSGHEDVKYALEAKLATPTELLAAGYNSNAAKLPGYIRRGGAGWRTLIPRETQMYLQIYRAVEAQVPVKSRPSPAAPPVN
jgi:hypothetical protein